MSENTTAVEEIETEIPADAQADASPEPDPITEIMTGECPSVSGRSILTYAVGRHQETGELHLRIVDNSGKGMWFPGWASAADIDALVKGRTDLTAKSFHDLHPGKSINTGGFVLAALVDLGLLRANEQNSRHQEHVPTTTLEKQVIARMGKTMEAAPVNKPVKRKGKAV